MNESRVAALIEQLKQPALQACANAHARYSDFPVGAAVVSDDGGVYAGCNVENASYGLTICAERNALAHAVARGVRPRHVSGLLIYTPGDVPHSPCGACRQVMHELLDEEAVIVACCDGRTTRAWTVGELIPEPFKF